MEKLKKLFAEFINGLSNFELEGFCASKLDINWDGEGFFVVQYGDSSGVKVFDSDGQADAPISVSKMKKFLISNSENFLQGFFMDEGGFDFNTFFIDRCKYYNRAFCAPPGVHLPEAGAAALNDFIVFATQITEIKVGEKNIEG